MAALVLDQRWSSPPFFPPLTKDRNKDSINAPVEDADERVTNGYGKLEAPEKKKN